MYIFMAKLSLSQRAADRNLLFGILAVQMDFIGRDSLIQAMHAWILEKSKSLGQILQEQGALGHEEDALLEALITKYVEKHGGDVQKSLSAIRSVALVTKELEAIADPEVQGSLAHLTKDPYETIPGIDLFRTVAPLVEAPPSPGRRFRILRPHARGGLGQVSVALDQELKREVALKEIQERFADHLESRSRFLLEAEVTGKLEHPGIVPVYGLGTSEDGRPYYAMRFIRGESLKEEIDRFHSADAKKFNPGERLLALRKLLQRFISVCDAVGYAHSRGVLHRDLKPGNIMLGKYGETLVVDWGLARLTDDETAFTSLVEDGIKCTTGTSSTLTQMGGVLGTPQFMSPEQAEGKLGHLSPASDVYSLGATLYYLLTGQVPFAQTEVEEILSKVAKSEFPRPRAVDPSVPAALEAICLHAMALRSTDRYRSCAALSADLDRWLADEPVNAYREPWPRRLARWRRRHRTLVTSASIVLVMALASLIFGDFIVEREHRRALALAQVDALTDASAATVPFLLQEIAPQRSKLQEKLAAKWQDASLRPGQRLRIGLALADDPAIRTELVEMACGAADPDEVLLVRDALLPYREEMQLILWRQVDAADIQPHKRIPMLAILASLDPNAAEWPQHASATVDQYLAANPLHLGSWKTAFEPIRQSLLPPLRKAFRDSSVTDRSRLAALVADFAHDQPEVLADLLMDADEFQYPILLALVQRQRETAVARLHRELDQVLVPNWHDAPLDPSWKPLDPVHVRAIENAGGFSTDYFALCQTLPLEQLDSLTAGLAQSGYRLVNLRPYTCGPNVQVAAVWSRDGHFTQAAHAAHGLTAEAAALRDEDWRKQGLIPLDVAAYLVAGEVRYAVLWGPKEAGVDDARLLIGATAAALQTALAPLQKAGYVSRTQAHRAIRGQNTYCAIWWKPAHALETSIAGASWTQADYLSELTPSNLQVDLRLDWNPAKLERPRNLAIACLGFTRAGALGGTPWLPLALAAEAWKSGPPGLEFGATWVDSSVRISEELHGLDPAAHSSQARTLSAQGFRPIALTVVEAGGTRLLTGSVWHRPVVPEAEKDALARRQAQAAVALLQLEAPDRVWPLLEHTSDPRVRSFLIHRLNPLKADVQVLLTRLEGEVETSRRRALVLALGSYPFQLVPEWLRPVWLERLRRWYRDEPDSGLHGAVDWLLRRWGDGPQVTHMEKLLRGQAPALGKLASNKQWMIDGQGHTLVMIPGGAEFWMGSPGDEVGRVARDEPLHRVRIPRGYVIGAKTVTVENFLRFRPDHRWLKRYSPRADGPMVNVTWYRAAEYCNWLSAQEGIPPSEWCYLPNKEGQFAAGMQLAPNYLEKKGYRLPTEAEWENACRAGAMTRRFYGNADELLKEYATFSRATAEEAAERAGLQKPNEFGIFDIYGNAAEWTQDPARPYQWDSSRIPQIDREFPLEITNAMNRVLRGGSFVNPALSLRSAYREEDPPTDVSDPSGLRVVRTYP